MGDRQQHLEIARKLAKDGQVDDAYRIVDQYLKKDPNDLPFLTVMTYILMSSDKPAIAYHMAKQCTQLAPKDPTSWVNMGMAAQDLWQSKEAERAYKRGLKVCKDLTDEQKREQEIMLYVNLCALYLDTGRFDEAEPWAIKTLKLDPAHQKGLSNLGFCQLAMRNWKEGWVNYHRCLGHEWRPTVNYNGEPEWNGEQQGKVVLYSEQGLGDCLSFASMVPDASKVADIILDVNECLVGLLQRSFPDVKVYGTRMKKNIRWHKDDNKIDASISMGQIGEFFRNKDSDFPGTPYLVPDPDRSFMWKELFKAKGKPCIGFAYSGGIPKTASRYRQMDLEQMLPIFKSVDAHWVCLQYRPAGKELARFRNKHPDIDIVEYPHATLTKDYDDTAALVSALNMVVTMQTAITHLAGGLGIPCWTFIPTTSQWRYGMDTEEYIWARSVKLIRQTKSREWQADIQRVAKDLHALFGRVPKTAKKAARKGQLWRNGQAIRPVGVEDHRSNGGRPPAGLRLRQEPESDENPQTEA